MPYQIIRNDITKVEADVIVNTANPHPVIGRGTDSAIYAAAGEEQLLAERKKIGDIARGEVAVTPAFNMDRKLFSKISKNVNYQPKKKTALALAIALQLDLPEMEDLISRAGFALSPSNRSDLIVSFFVTQKKYDIMEIDSALFEYGQPTLFSEE